MPRCLAVAVIALVALAPRDAQAEGEEEPREPVSMTVSAPPGCTSEADFVREVFTRTQRARVVTEAEAERRFTVRLEAQRGAFRGTLTIEEKDATKRQRVLMGRGCTALASALALVTALTIDPQASTRPAAELLPVPPPPPAPPPPILPPPDATPEPTEAVAARLPVARTAPLPPPTLSRPGPRFDVGGFVGVGLLVGPLPDVVGTFEGGGLLAHRTGLHSELRFAVAATLPDTTNAAAGSARFNALRVSLEACPIRYGDRFSLSPCVAASGGWIAATASDLPDPRSETRGLASLGVALHGAFRQGILFVDTGLEAAVSLVRARYYVDPNVDIFRTPWLLAAVTVRIGAIAPGQD